MELAIDRSRQLVTLQLWYLKKNLLQNANCFTGKNFFKFRMSLKFIDQTIEEEERKKTTLNEWIKAFPVTLQQTENTL